MLGGLGLLLTAGSIVGLLAEMFNRKQKPKRLILLMVSGVVYLAAFISEPPAAWSAIGNSSSASAGTSLRALALGLFMACASLAFTSACRKIDELCKAQEEQQQ